MSGLGGGVLTSPNYPDPYDNNDYCLWTIAVAPGERIDVCFICYFSTLVFKSYIEEKLVLKISLFMINSFCWKRF